MGAQEIFDQAYQHYSKATGILSEFGEMLEKATKGNFTNEVALTEFDCILQYILLYEAIADNKVSRLERQFIEKITDRGDILVGVSKRVGREITWASLEGMDSDEGMKVISEMTPSYAEILHDFCGSVAKADGIIKDIDLFEMINESIVAIFASLAAIDGDVSDDEGAVVCNAYMDLFVEYYKKAVAEGENL